MNKKERDRKRYYEKRRVGKICSKCKKEYAGDERSRSLCRSCVAKEVNGRLDFSGEKNPNWKGGHSRWMQGKLGRDKDGLSWKVQRKLAWERDDYTCQNPECRKKEKGWKPDCHHIVPYRISFSHSLENLNSLCRSCHKKEEAKIVELWGGESLRPPVRERLGDKWYCSLCGKKRKLVEGICWPCRKERLVKKAVSLRKEGNSYQKIGDILGGLDRRLVWSWLN